MKIGSVMLWTEFMELNVLFYYSECLLAPWLWTARNPFTSLQSVVQVAIGDGISVNVAFFLEFNSCTGDALNLWLETAFGNLLWAIEVTLMYLYSVGNKFCTWKQDIQRDIAFGGMLKIPFCLGKEVILITCSVWRRPILTFDFLFCILSNLGKSPCATICGKGKLL